SRPSSTTWGPISTSSPRQTPAPMTANGPMRTPGPIWVPGCTTAVAWISAVRSPTAPGSLARPETALQRVQTPTQGPHVPQQLREAPDRRQRAQARVAPHRGRADHSGARRDVAVDTGLRPDLGAVAHRHVIRDACLPSQDHAAPDPARARDSCLGDDDG